MRPPPRLEFVSLIERFMIATTSPVDFIEELRLRRWARENYAAACERQSSWHPIIHDEMIRIDGEEAATARDVLSEDGALSGEILLENDRFPTPTDSTILTDLPDVAEITVAPQPTVYGPATLGPPFSLGPIVPLVPDLPGLHGPHEITPPHTRIEAPVASTEMHYT